MAVWKILLAVWLVLWGILAITNVKFDGENLIMGCLAIGAGIFMVVSERQTV